MPINNAICDELEKQKTQADEFLQWLADGREQRRAEMEEMQAALAWCRANGNPHKEGA